MNNSNKNIHIDDTHKYIDLVRRLEQQEYIFAIDPKTATETAKHHTGSFLEKLAYRASLLDDAHQLRQTLKRIQTGILWLGKAYALLYFLLGFVGVFGLLSSQIVNFFYVLIGLLGWHTITLLWGVYQLYAPSSHTVIYALLDKITPKELVARTAFTIELEVFQLNDTYKIATVIHRAWLLGLFGSVLALLTLFLFKSYTFTWESTLLTHTHFAQIIHALAIIPDTLGIPMPSQSSLIQGTPPPTRLAILMIISVILYGMLPRALVYGYCLWRGRSSFKIDTNLYYYEHLFRQFNQHIINQDDFVPTPAKPVQATVSTRTKIVATLERKAPEEFWYQFGAGFDVKDVGVLDTKDDMATALTLANTFNAQLYLGIDSHALPDRGLLRKFDGLCQQAPCGIVVELLGAGDHLDAWRQVLIDRHIQEVRY